MGLKIVLEKQQEIVTEKSSSMESKSFVGTHEFHPNPLSCFTTTSGEEVWTLKLWQWFKGSKGVESHELEQMGKRSPEMMMIHKFVLCIYTSDESQSWITLELCFVDAREFSPQFFCSLSLALNFHMGLWRTSSFETPVTTSTTKGIGNAHQMVFWSESLGFTRHNPFSLLIDEVRVKNHHENEIKLLTHFIVSLHVVLLNNRKKGWWKILI